MSLFPRRTAPGGTVVVHVRLERSSGSLAPWSIAATLTGPDGLVRARFCDGGTLAPGPTRIDRYFSWTSNSEDPPGQYEARLLARAGDRTTESATLPDDHVHVEQLNWEGSRILNPGPVDVVARLFAVSGELISEITVPALGAMAPPADAMAVEWADGRVLALRRLGVAD